VARLEETLQDELPFTGEQVVKGVTPDRIWQDHMARYEHAAPMVKGLRVLDVACGSGYGSHHLATAGGAHAVEGVDISQDVVDHARATYKAPALSFRHGSILDLPFADASFDAVTCFETIEHVDDDRGALAQLRRVLRPGGVLWISTPNRLVTSPLKGLRDPPNNRHHVREYTRREFETLLIPYFRIERLLGQRNRPALLFRPAVYRRIKQRRKAWYDPALGDPSPRPVPPLSEARYFVCECRRP
jgi:O-antigen biosynthesis protein